MAKNNKVYAIKKGRKTGLFYNWDDCKAQVMGYPGAVYKSFPTEEEAKNYLEEENNNIKKIEEMEQREDAAKAFVDGSYNQDTQVYGCGVNIKLNNETTEFSCSDNKDNMKTMRNVSGEIMGSVISTIIALSKGAKKLIIYYDYQGIASWVDGSWKASTEGTIAYRDFMTKIQKDCNIDICFQKVKAHTGIELNERVDTLAKQAVGIVPETNTANLVLRVPFNYKDYPELQLLLPEKVISPLSYDISFNEKEESFIKRNKMCLAIIEQYIVNNIKESSMEIKEIILEETDIEDSEYFDMVFDKIYKEMEVAS